MENIRHKERVIDLDLLKLLGIVIVIVGFVMKMDSILIIMAAAIVTALVSGMDLVTSFVSNRSMCTFIIVFLVTGTLERNGLKQAASHLMTRFKNATAGMVIGIYGVFRLFFAAFNISFGGAAGFIRPIVMPMATAAVERDGHPIDPDHLEQLKGMSAGMDNVAWFFGQVLFVGTSGMLLVQSTLADLGYEVELIDLTMVQIPVALCAVGIAIVYYYLKDRQLSKKRQKAGEA